MTAVVFMNLWENAAWVEGPPAKFSVHALNPLADPFMKEPSVAKFKPAPQGYTTPSGQPWPPIDTHAKGGKREGGRGWGGRGAHLRDFRRRLIPAPGNTLPDDVHVKLRVHAHNFGQIKLSAGRRRSDTLRPCLYFHQEQATKH